MGSEVTFYACNRSHGEPVPFDADRWEIARRDDFPGVLWLLHFRISDWVWISEDAGAGERHSVPYLICDKNKAILQFEAGLAVFREKFSRTKVDFEDELSGCNAMEKFVGYINKLSCEAIMMDIYFGWNHWKDLLWRQALLGIEDPDILFTYSAELVERLGVDRCREMGVEGGAVMTWQGALRRLCVPALDIDMERWRNYCNEESSDLIGDAIGWCSGREILGVSGHYQY